MHIQRCCPEVKQLKRKVIDIWINFKIKKITLGSEGAYGKYPTLIFEFEGNGQIVIPIDKKNYRKLKRLVLNFDIYGNRSYLQNVFKENKKLREEIKYLWNRIEGDMEKTKMIRLLRTHLHKNEIHKCENCNSTAFLGDIIRTQHKFGIKYLGKNGFDFKETEFVEPPPRHISVVCFQCGKELIDYEINV